MNTTAIVDNPQTNPFEFYARHGAALFPLHYGKKDPDDPSLIVRSFLFDCSTDPAQWRAWRAAWPNCNFGLVACRSGRGWITIDIDVPAGEDGRERAWAAWCKVWTEWGLPGFPPTPTCQSPGGGWHYHFEVPEGVNAFALNQPDIRESGITINIRVRGFTVAAPSYFDNAANKPGKRAGHYILLSDAPPIPAPPALIEHCRGSSGKVKRPTGEFRRGDTDPELVKQQIKWVRDNVDPEHPDHPFTRDTPWYKTGMQFKLEGGNAWFEIWAATFNFDDDRNLRKAISRWESFDKYLIADPTTIASWHETLKYKLDCPIRSNPNWKPPRQSAAEMFAQLDAANGNVIPFPPPASITLPADTPSPTGAPAPAKIGLEHFLAYRPMPNAFIFTKTGDIWPGTNVNHELPPVPLFNADGSPKLNDKKEQVRILAANWIAQNRVAHQMSWVPGEPMEIKGKIVSEGGLIDDPSINVFNLYRPPAIKAEPGDVSLWVDHMHAVFPEDAEHIIAWLAHRVQRPQDKINHNLLLIGKPGIGKDTALEPVKAAVGPWNCTEVRPSAIMGRFNGFVKSVILRVSEVHDLGDSDKFSFYERMKGYAVSPPDVIRIDEKHLREYSVPNVFGVVMTSNHKTGIFLPTDDRRNFVAESPLPAGHFPREYFNRLYGWFAAGGNEHVAHYLAHLDISGFDAKASPRKTRAFWDIVDASKAAEDAEMADALDGLGRPPAVTLADIRGQALGKAPAFHDWLRDKKNARLVAHRMDECDYVPIRNPAPKDGLWVIGGKRMPVYTKRELSLQEQIAAATALTVSSPPVQVLPPGYPLPRS